MGRNLKQGAIGQQEHDQRHKLRDHNRETWYVRKDERRFVLRHRAGPGRQGTCLGLTVVTGITVSPGMEMETPRGRPFEINKARVTHEAGNHTDSHQQTGDDKEHLRGPPRSPTKRHDVEDVVHQTHFRSRCKTPYHTKLLPSCLLPPAHGCYIRRSVTEMDGPRTCRSAGAEVERRASNRIEASFKQPRSRLTNSDIDDLWAKIAIRTSCCNRLSIRCLAHP